MSGQLLKVGDKITMRPNDLQGLFTSLSHKGYRLLGPILKDGAIVYDDISSLSEMPRGWTEKQDAAIYRLKKRNDEAYFGYTLGPQSWKKYLYPSSRRLFAAEKDKSGFKVIEEKAKAEKLAFIGVRPCEISAIKVLDKVLENGPFKDNTYVKKRTNTFILAVNCAHAGGTCFCVSTKTGPKATANFDLALTEVLNDDRHVFVIEIGSDSGAEVVSSISAKKSSANDIAAADKVSIEAAQKMGRSLDISGIKELINRNFDNPRWDNAAKRCLSCGNCTMVCPTCFCTSVQDVTDLSGKQAERWQNWDSCYMVDFSYIHGGSIRPSVKARYRQWASHKMGYWLDQFDTLGCIGCGRCITWCPAAIDITEEVTAIRDSERKQVVVTSVKERKDANN
jgi:sulfhydrogenase subunit beta (sulfur reductase)